MRAVKCQNQSNLRYLIDYTANTAARESGAQLSSVLVDASSAFGPPLIQQVLLPCRHYLCSLLYRAVFLRSTVSLAARCLPFQAHGRVRNAVEVAFHPEVRALDLLGTACWACGCGRGVCDDLKLLTTFAQVATSPSTRSPASGAANTPPTRPVDPRTRPR